MNHITNRELGARIRAARESAQLTQEELANGLRVKQPSIAHWESGRREVGIHMLLSIAHLTERPLEYFLPVESTSLRPFNRELADRAHEFERKISAQDRLSLANGARALVRHPEILLLIADYLDPKADNRHNSGALRSGVAITG